MAEVYWLGYSLSVLVSSISSKKRNMLRLTAKDTQFGKPTFQSWLIESAGTLPIKRRKDHAEGEADNTLVMESLVGALGEGDAICLFPEGMSRYHPSVAPLKTGETTQHAVRSLTTFLYDQITQGTITAPSWKVIRTAKAAARIYVPLGTGMGLGDWVRVVGRFAGEDGFGGVGQLRNRKRSPIRSTMGNPELAGVEWQPSPMTNGDTALPEQSETPSVSDEFVESLSNDIELYQTHLERLGLKDFRVLQYSTLSRRRIIVRILTRIPLATVLGALALPGLVLWLPVFLTVSYFTKKHKQAGPVWDTYDEISQTKLIYGLAAGTITWLICCLATLPFAPITASAVPVIMWMTLRWTEDLIASVRATTALTRLLLIGKPEMSKTLLWRQNIHERVMRFATERLDLPANPETFFSTQSSPGPRWDTKGGADKGRTQGLWARGTRYFSLRRRRKRDWNETMRWYDQTYLPEDES
ncbi:hypothetical protein FRC10_009364 [Ceratobasidium sp. 414]|nr:hypothetical protein FRC10_009364 [Ceratobasidium sp. 414]